jgi:hypothetical protein
LKIDARQKPRASIHLQEFAAAKSIAGVVAVRPKPELVISVVDTYQFMSCLPLGERWIVHAPG